MLQNGRATSSLNYNLKELGYARNKNVVCLDVTNTKDTNENAFIKLKPNRII